MRTLARRRDRVMIRNLDLRVEEVRREPSVCASCGMATKHPCEYHPYAACALFGVRSNGDWVRAQLEQIIQDAQKGSTRERTQ